MKLPANLDHAAGESFMCLRSRPQVSVDARPVPAMRFIDNVARVDDLTASEARKVSVPAR